MSTETPIAKWESVRRFNSFLLKYVGCEIFEDGYKIHFETWIPMYIALNYFLLLLYTLYYYRQDFFKAMQPTPTIGQVVPVS